MSLLNSRKDRQTPRGQRGWKGGEHGNSKVAARHCKHHIKKDGTIGESGAEYAHLGGGQTGETKNMIKIRRKVQALCGIELGISPKDMAFFIFADKNGNCKKLDNKKK